MDTGKWGHFPFARGQREKKGAPCGASLMAAQSDVQAVRSCAAARIAIPQKAFVTPIIVPSEAKDGVVPTPPPCGYPEGAAVRPPSNLSVWPGSR